MVSSIIPTTERVLRLNLEKGGPGRVLGPMELSLVAGETVALTGPSGAGKTSLLRIIAGLDKRFDGRLETAGRIAIVFQEPVLLPWRTALQNLTIVARISETEAQHWLEKVDLGARCAFSGHAFARPAATFGVGACLRVQTGSPVDGRTVRQPRSGAG